MSRFFLASGTLQCHSRCAHLWGHVWQTEVPAKMCAEWCPIEWDTGQATEIREVLSQDTLHWNVFVRTDGIVTWFVCRVSVFRCSLKAPRFFKASPFTD